jgi:hypothetical protein
MGRSGFGRLRAGRLTAAFVALALVVAGLVGASLPGATESASAVSGSQFDPGNIISDHNFYDANAMTAAQIQAFFNSHIGGCANSNCLGVYTTATTTKPQKNTDAGTLVCQAYAGSAGESAATIIFKVQQACSISAKVILVTLQKEQGLISNAAPSDGVMQRAMGYGCPDSTGGTCDSQYYGFFNQVYWAAWQLKRYGTNVPFGTFQPGVRAIAYSPNASCGSGAVNILNNATAALYNYTPYQPNAAALANLNGIGDGCSSYGNRNFWVYYNNWFGSPSQAPGTPEGNVTSITTDSRGVTVSGWVVDPDAVTAPVVISFQLGQTWQALTADQPGDDQSSVYPGAGSSHAFSGLLPMPPGTYSLCIYPINSGGAGTTGSLGCSTVTVPLPPPPVGAIQTGDAAGQSIAITGWAVKPDAPTSPVSLAVNIGSRWIAMTANLPNTAAPTQIAGAGANQGFSGTVAAAPGLQTFCVWGAPTAGPAVSIGCRSVVVPPPQLAVTKLESVTTTSSSTTVTGYSVWPNAVSQSVPLAVNIGSNWYAVTANQPSSTAAAAVSGAGPNHGFTLTIPSSSGSRSVCLWSTELSGSATLADCQTATTSTSPTGVTSAFETVAGGSSAITFSGWSIWPGSLSGTVPVAINIDSSWYAVSANQASTTGAAAVAGAGPNHGFTGSIPASIGAHTVCVWATQPASGAVEVGCKPVTVSAGLPTLGAVSNISAAVGGVHVDGWAVMPSTPTTAANVAATVNGQWLAVPAGKPNAIAPTQFSGAGPNQGFSGLFPTGTGPQTLCVYATSGTGAVNLGCQTVTVSPAPESIAVLSSVLPTAGGVTVTGWASWPSALSTSVPVAVDIDALWTAIPSNLPNSDAPDFVKGAGPNQGFGATVPATSGSHSVCVWITQPVTTAALFIGCQTVTVP